MLPALPPSWDGLHPLVVHFPIALFVVAPIFVLLGVVTGMRSFMLSALLLLVMGTVASFVATNTGEAAYDAIEPDEVMEILDPDYEYDDVATAHGEQTELARNIFTGITVLYSALVIAAYLKPATVKLKPRLALGLVILALCGWGNLVMANAAHLGGELVHIHGVRAVLGEADGEPEQVDDEDRNEVGEDV